MSELEAIRDAVSDVSDSVALHMRGVEGGGFTGPQWKLSVVDQLAEIRQMLNDALLAQRNEEG